MNDMVFALIRTLQGKEMKSL